MEVITTKIKNLIKRIKTGSTPSTNNILNFENSNFNWFTPGDFSESNTILTSSERKISEYAVQNSATIFEEKTILITCIGDIGNSGIIEQRSSANQQITGIVVDEKIIDPYFFNYLVRFNKNLLRDKSNVAIVPILNNKNLQEIEFSFPKDLEYQKRIVAILDKVKSILSKRSETIEKYDELLRANFLNIFGNPMERPNKWKLDSVGNGLSNLSSGVSYSGEENKVLDDDELGVLKVSAVTKGEFNSREFKAVKKDIIKRKTIHPRKGDLLFCRANTLELVGTTCIVDKDYNDLFLPDKIWKIETNESILKKVYLHYVLQNNDLRQSFLLIATGSSGSMLNISMEKFRRLVIPYPTIELQNQFEETYLKYIKIKAILKKSHLAISELFASIAQLAFNAKLNINSAVDLELLLENDYEFFKENSNYAIIKLLLQRLDKDDLNKNRFFNQVQYDTAKKFVFELLKEKKIKQEFDKKSKSLKLTL